MTEGIAYGDIASPSILLVEDNPLHVRLVRTMINDMWPGFENLQHVARLDHAIQHVKVDRPDCILLDLVLPDADGLEAVEAMLHADASVPIVVLSAHDDELTAAEAVRKGAQDYLVKGHVTAERLSRAVRFAIERTRGAEGADSPPAFATATAVLDVNGSVIVADPALASLLGRDLSSIVGAPLESLAHGDDLGAWRSALDQVGVDIPASLLVRMIRGDDTEQRCRVTLSALADGSGDTAAFIAGYRALAAASSSAPEPALTASA